MQTKPTQEAVWTYKKLFTDYCNHRDRIKSLTNTKYLELSKHQENQLVVMARKSYRQREWVYTANWFSDLFRETQQFFSTLKFRDWPLMRKR